MNEIAVESPKDLPKKSHKALRRLLTLFLVGITIWLGPSLIVVYKLTQRRNPAFNEPSPSIDWANFKSLHLKTTDKQTIGAWFHQGLPEAPAVLFLHGNGGSRKHSLKYAKLFNEKDCSLLLISLRAHGESSGDYNDIGYGARHDVIAAVSYLEEHCPGRPIIIFGSSLGAAAALFAGGELGDRVSGYILESPYQDLKTAVWNRVELALPPIIANIVYQGLIIVSPLVIPHLDQISPVNAIDQIPTKIPVLIMAGTEDRLARPAEAEALWSKIKDRATLHLFERADHVQMIEIDPSRYRAAVLDFLSQVSQPRIP